MKLPVEPDTDSSNAHWANVDGRVSAGDSSVPLEAVIRTDELDRRVSRPADFEAENRALASLMQEMAGEPANILQKLVETALSLCRAQSAGISLLQEENDRQVFVWRALAGECARFVGSTLPRELSPCGAVLDRDAPLLMSCPERHFATPPGTPPIVEVLSVPFHRAGKAVGTLWIGAHDESRRFDAEDKRLLTHLGNFASTAYQVLTTQEREARAIADMTEKRAATQLLQNVSTRPIHEGDIDALYREILDAAIDLMRSDMASMQMFYPERGALRLLAWKGFTQSSAACWEWVHAGSISTCSEALRIGSRVIVPDVETCEFITGTPDVEALRASGIRAVQSTPLVSRSGRPLGMISTHWRKPHQPTEQNLRLFDVLARQAADLIERAQTEARLRESEARATRILESMADSLQVLDADWRLTYMNAASRRTLAAQGLEPDKLIGKHFWNDIFPEERGTALEREYRRAMTQRVRVELDYLHQPWQRWYAIRTYPVEEGGLAIYFQDITEKKRWEEKARARFDELENIYRTAPIGLALIDNEFRFARINERLAEINGVPAEQHLGRSLREILPTLADQAEEIFRRVFRTGEPVLNAEFARETRARPSVRQTRNESWYPLKDAAGETVAVNIVVEEITERKQAEEALAHFAAIVASSADAIVSKTLGGIVTSWNTSAEQMFGYTAQEMIGQPVLRLIPPERREEEDVILARLKAGERIEHYETVRVTKGGRRLHVSLTISPVKNSAGRIIGASKIARDITERKRAEELLRSNAKQLALITSTAPAFIAYFDAQARFRFANKAYAARFGLTPEDCIGKRLAEVIGERAYETLRKYIEMVLRGEPVEFEIAIPYAAIGERFMHCSYAPELDARGNVVGFVGAVTDITERKRVEEALRGSEERLKEADRRKDEFLATLAHELRNPLAPLHYAMHVMKLKGNDAPAVERCHSMMERQLGHMVRLIDDLLDVSRISRGKIELRKERVELARIVHQAVETNRPLAEASGLDLAIEVPAEPTVVDADVARLAQVVDNLLNNACKFTPAGGRIRLAVERDGEQAVIRVRDTGVGIAPYQFAHIFEMFTQVDTSLERTQSGLGIGLTLAKTLTQMHGGMVDVQSAGVGQGSEFTVRLPVAVRAPDAARPEPAAGELARASPLRILVVDDNADSADSLATLLELAGHETHVARDGLEALHAAAAVTPDVVLLDIGLPKLNGYDVARRIRQQPWGRGMVLVALTGWGQDNDREKSKDAGFDNHLVKPVDYGALLKLFAERGRNEHSVSSQPSSEMRASQ